SNDDKAILNKLVWASEYCPEGKWGTPPPEPPKPAWPEEMPKDFKLIAGGSGACACCPIVTSCCPNDALPQTLTLTVTGSVDCAGTYTLTYSSVNNDWEYAGVIGSCNLSTKPLRLACVGLPLQWTMIGGNLGTSVVASSVTCNPLDIQFPTVA